MNNIVLSVIKKNKVEDPHVQFGFSYDCYKSCDALECELLGYVKKTSQEIEQYDKKFKNKKKKTNYRKRNMKIDSFQGEYRWLSNFWPVPIKFDGETYPSVEHAYQAAKTLDKNERIKIKLATTPGSAKRLGKRIKIRPDWNDNIKLTLMEEFLIQKFSVPFLQKLLLNTGNAELIEGNNWKDTFWGVYQGRGENHLGKILK